MNERDVEITAYALLAEHGIKAIDIIIEFCDDAAKVGAEDILSFWNNVLNLIYGWEHSDPAS